MTTNSLAWTSSTGGGRVRGNVPESLINRLMPLATEMGAAAPVAPSSDVRERLGTAPSPRTQPLERRLGRSVDQNQTSSQTVSRRDEPPAAAIPASTKGQSTSAVPAEGIEPSKIAEPCCFGTVQPPAVGDKISQTCRRFDFEHDRIDVSGGRKEDNRWRGSLSSAIISKTGRGLAVSGRRTV